MVIASANPETANAESRSMVLVIVDFMVKFFLFSIELVVSASAPQAKRDLEPRQWNMRLKLQRGIL
jgi:hypothetical protein